jgi:two-component system, LuxR family, response regulator DctR
LTGLPCQVLNNDPSCFPAPFTLALSCDTLNPMPFAPSLDPALGIPVVYLVDDEDVVRDALAWLLRSRRLLSEGFAGADVFETFLNDATGPSRAPWPQSPSCLVLDVRMPGTSGLVLFERLVQRGLLPWLPVIFLTGHGDVPTAVAAVKRGAFDFVEKPFSNNTLVDRIELALHTSAQALLQRRRQETLARTLAELTEREHEVMQRVIDGRPNKLIADELDISVRTVEVHRARVFEKMHVKSAVELSNLLRGRNSRDRDSPGRDSPNPASPTHAGEADD